MPDNIFHPALFNPFMMWTDLVMKSTEMMVSSSQLIGERVDELTRASANPSPRDSKELTQMGAQQVKAATESGMAVANQLQTANYQLITHAWEQWFASMAAMAALTSSPTFGEALSRQNRLFNSLSRSNRTHSKPLPHDTTHAADAVVKPTHAAASADTKRHTRTKPRAAARR